LAASEQDRKGLLALVVLFGATGLAASLGGWLVSTGVWLVGPVLGIGSIVSFFFFLRTRPERRLILVAGIGVACGVVSVAVPGFLLYASAFAGD
jgi:hypothetical protein